MARKQLVSLFVLIAVLVSTFVFVAPVHAAGNDSTSTSSKDVQAWRCNRVLGCGYHLAGNKYSSGWIAFGVAISPKSQDQYWFATSAFRARVGWETHYWHIKDFKYSTLEGMLQ